MGVQSARVRGDPQLRAAEVPRLAPCHRQAFGQPKAVAGRQTADLGGAELWIAPNPSGQNPNATLASLAADYSELA